MHEMSIASELLRTVLAVAAENGAARVEEVEIQAGAMKLIVPEALELAWSVLAAGTPAEEARLKLTEVRIEAECRQCGRRFGAAVDGFACPGCGQADVEIVAGDDIILTSVVCRGPDQAEGP